MIRHAGDLDAEVLLHRLTTSLEESTRRAQRRTADGTPFAHPIDLADNEHLVGLMEEPNADEGFSIIAH